MTPILSLKVLDLEISPQNARKTFDAASISELKASLLAHGQLQNLTVMKGKDGYEVVSGARRLTAMKEAIKEGSMQKTAEALCLILEPEEHDNAAEISLAENVVRTAMHPADEFETYARLVKNGMKPTEIAINFGVSLRHVEGRLKLARLDKTILKAFRDKKISFEQVMAFTITDDKKKQLEVLKRINENWRGDSIRGLLTEGMVEPEDQIAKFVGLKAYKDAGGKFREDLFGKDVYFEDEALLLDLAKKKLQPAADKLKAEGWGWVEIVPLDTYEFTSKLGRDYDRKPAKKKMALMGAIVAIGHKGEPFVQTGFIKREDAAKLKAESKDEKGGSTASMPAGREKGGLTQALRTSLGEQRQRIMQYAVAGDCSVAADLLHYAVAYGVLADGDDYYGHAVPWLAITAKPREIESFPESSACKGMGKYFDQLNLKWTKEKTDAARFLSFRALKQPEKDAIIAYAVGSCIERLLAPADKYDDDNNQVIETALALTGVDVAAHWRPTKENYLSHITTDMLLAIGQAVAGGSFIGDKKSLKKAQLVEVLDKTFAGKGEKLPSAVAERVAAWLPPEMPFAAPEKGAAKAKGKKAA